MVQVIFRQLLNQNLVAPMLAGSFNAETQRRRRREERNFLFFFASLRFRVKQICRGLRLTQSFLLLSLLLSSCGYRWHPEYPELSRPSIQVPFICGDEDGSLTNEVIRQLSSSGLADVDHRKGDYRLEASIVDVHSETVGFRRDRQIIHGKQKKNLLACEGRTVLTVEVSLFEGDSSRVAYGPYRVTADVDYDYVDGDSAQDLSFTAPDGVFTTVLPFSLGQLESSEAAQEAATRPLYGKLAQKIVDVISSEW
jgi:hypothetical protein